MKKTFIIAFTLLLAAVAFAQTPAIPRCYEIVQVEDGDGDVVVEIIDMPDNAAGRYWLCVGSLGIGDEILQVNFDPLYKLYVRLGDTLEDVQRELESLKAFAREMPGTSREALGCFVPTFPDDRLETVRIAACKVLLSRKLEFSIKREGYLRATYINRQDISSLLFSIKAHRAIHKDK